MMKKTILLAAMLWLFQLSATHIKTSRLDYNYIGGKTGVANQYEIIVSIYQSHSGIGPSASLSIEYSSTCATTQITTANLDTTFIEVPGQMECTIPDSNQNITYDLDVHVYIDTVVLSPCADWDIAWRSCCRGYTFTSNISATGNTYGYNASASLNNLSNENSSAVPLDKHPKDLCVGRTVIWTRDYIDPDGDSIHVEPASIIDGSSSTYTNILFDSAYSVNKPLDLDSAIGYQVDPKTGNITFKPTTQGVYLLGFVIKEYKWDNTLGVYHLAGQSFDETLIFVTANCAQPTEKTDLYRVDTISMDYTSTGINLKLLAPFYNKSLVHTDFALYKPSGGINPIIKQEVFGGSYNTFDSIQFSTHYSFSENGFYVFESRTGNDGNTLFGPCGLELKKDKLYIEVTNAPDVHLDEHNMEVNLYPNPSDEHLIIQTPHFPFNYEIINLNGVSLYKGKCDQNTLEIETNLLKSGYYLLKTTKEDRSSTIPFTVLHQ